MLKEEDIKELLSQHLKIVDNTLRKWDGRGTLVVPGSVHAYTEMFLDKVIEIIKANK